MDYLPFAALFKNERLLQMKEKLQGSAKNDHQNWYSKISVAMMSLK
jgi:hypothetical protein